VHLPGGMGRLVLSDGCRHVSESTVPERRHLRGSVPRLLLRVSVSTMIRARATNLEIYVDPSSFSCPSGTDGKQCETAPERCIGNPCMHHGRCQDFGSGLNCTCPDDYTGIGCQYEYDACQAGACKNGATCIDEGPGFTCICPPGYTGTLLYQTRAHSVESSATD